MEEREYVVVTNLAKIRAAQCILAGVFAGDEYSTCSAGMKSAISKLADIETDLMQSFGIDTE